jgi:hypothetical protein
MAVRKPAAGPAMRPTAKPASGPSGAGTSPIPQKPSPSTGPGGAGNGVPTPGKSGK